jgi:hypothetical protein
MYVVRLQIAPFAQHVVAIYGLTVCNSHLEGKSKINVRGVFVGFIRRDL